MTFTISPISTLVLEQLLSKFKKHAVTTSSIEVFKDIACKVAMIQNTKTPTIVKPKHFIVVASHGVADEFNIKNEIDLEIKSLIQGTSIINNLNRDNYIDITIVNAGLSIKLPKHNSIIDYKIGKQTRNYCKVAAMEFSNYEQGIANGVDLILKSSNNGINCISFGTIAPESLFSASFITSALTNTELEECISLNNTPKKDREFILEKIQKAYTLHTPMTLIDTMCIYGSYDMVTIVGGILKAAELNMVILIDSFVPAAALLYAFQINENVLDYCMFTNQSNHRGHQIIIDFFEKKTILDLDFESNLGLGVPIALPVINGTIDWLSTIQE